MNLIKSLLFGLFLFSQFTLNSQILKKNKSKVDEKITKEKKEKDVFKEKIKDLKKIEGLFNLYKDEEKGDLFIEINKNHLDKEFIHFSYIENGISDLGYNKGSYRGSKIFKIKKYFNKIEFIHQNSTYYYDESHPISKNSDANINSPIIASETILVSNNDSSKFLLDAGKLFLNENFKQIKRSNRPGYKGFSLGRLNKTKTKFRTVKNYPENTDLIINYSYDDLLPKYYGSSSVTDSRFVNILVQHTLMKLPENNYQTRFYDSRVGFFSTQINDMISKDSNNQIDLINRWHLVKKNPKLEISEPINPIIFWIENTTPHEFRDIIKEAVESWNFAFEKAGFKNAIRVKIQPEKAKWDAGDIRYNVLRWTSSPSPPFGGYGPSFTNPRTGQILGADIMLEWVYFTNRILYENIYTSSDIKSDDYVINDKITTDYSDDLNICKNSIFTHQNNMFGLINLKTLKYPEILSKDLIRQSLKRLVLHEVGHTLGLTHNFKGSTLLSYDEIQNKDITYEKGLCSSIMEYPSINITLDSENQGLFYDTLPGVYDSWAIQYGYSQINQVDLNKILDRSSDPELSYANDADDMRSTGKGSDPDAMVNDLTSDQVLYSTDRIKLINRLLTNYSNYIEDGMNYEELLNAFNILMKEYSTSLKIISRQIGGVKIGNSKINQNSSNLPFTPVKYDLQKEAFNAISDFGFSPKAFQYSQNMYRILRKQRRGFSTNSDPKIHEKVLSIQRNILSQLLNYTVIRRIVNSSLYGNSYSISEYFNDLTNSIFLEDINSKINSFRQNLQYEYLKNLIRISKITSSNSKIKTNIHYQLKLILDLINDSKTNDLESKIHLDYLKFNIEKLFDK